MNRPSTQQGGAKAKRKASGGRNSVDRGDLIYVDTERELERLVDDLAQQLAIAVDSEANPMFAYRERLCLLQCSTKDVDYVVDPLAPGVDLGLLGPIFADGSIVKVLHGAEFDVLMLKRVHPFEIRGLFDTRVAASSLGFPSPSLAAVLQEWVGVEVDKTHQRSDWGKRPLSDGQLEYARDDTRYLIELFERLREDLIDAGSPHLEEVASECRRVEMLVPEERGVDVDDWLRIKGATALDPVGQRILRDVNRFRHRIAEERDRPLFKVFGNEAVMMLGRSKPETLEQLQRCKAISPKLASRYGEDLVRIVANARQRGGLKRVPTTRRAPEDVLRKDQRVVFDAVRGFRKRVAERRNIDASIVLTKQKMIELAKARPVPDSVEKLTESRLLEPWRVAFYGEELARDILAVTEA